jgi:hypothetical protein
MANVPESGIALCYAEAVENRWAAYCLTFDLAVEGTSLTDVRAKLTDQIELYLETVRELPPADQRRLLKRRAPWREFANFFYWFTRTLFTTSGHMRSEYTEPYYVSEGCSVAA